MNFICVRYLKMNNRELTNEVETLREMIRDLSMRVRELEQMNKFDVDVSVVKIIELLLDHLNLKVSQRTNIFLEEYNDDI